MLTIDAQVHAYNGLDHAVFLCQGAGFEHHTASARSSSSGSRRAVFHAGINDPSNPMAAATTMARLAIS